MSVKSRLKRAEKTMGINEKHALLAIQSLEDGNCFMAGGEIYTRDGLQALREDYDVIILEYVEDWRGVEDEH